VVAWGYQFSGQLDVPEGLTDVVQIAAGQTFSLALKSDGTVVGWGTDPETGGTETPPAGLKGVVQVATSYDHALALKSDGTVVGWGRNLSGEMDVPTDLTGVVQVAGGFDFSLALKSDGTVVAWGSNNVEHQMDIPTGLVVTVP
jgi:Alpha-tubulin suppressor and related RCC1 domain-containing proteins